MNYLILVLVALIFVLGWKETKETLKHFQDLEERRNLLLRIGGFIVMSWWIHILPSIILTIYMKREGVMASELLDDDSNRAIVTSLFMTPEIAFLIIAASWGGIWTAIEKSKLSDQKISIAGGASIYLWGLWYFFRKYGLDYSLYVFLVSTPIIGYSYIALCAPIKLNIKYYWSPFALIIIVTFTLFAKDEITHSMVTKQLWAFGVGGNITATVSPKDGTDGYTGRLVLMTRESTYLRVDTATKDAKCIIRISNSAAIIGTINNSASNSDAQKNAARTFCGPH